jgi:hypothetical protein
MNKIEQLHLDAIENNYGWKQETASKSADITEQIAIEFQQWVENDCFKVLGTTKYRIGILDKSSIEYSIGELFQEFLKSKP